MGLTLLRMTVSSLFVIAVATVLFICETKTRLKNARPAAKQLLAGVIFGIVSILATEYGTPAQGATINVRTAAPITASLVFGSPAGILAGVIGALHRWFAVHWGAGEYSRLACTIATLLSGFIAAGARKLLHDEKRASWLFGLAVGIVIEVFHMLLLFITHMDNIEHSYTIIRICAPPMIFFNSVSVALTLFILSLIDKSRAGRRIDSSMISTKFQRMLLICVLIAIVLTTSFTYTLETQLALGNADQLLSSNLSDIKNAINAASDKNLLNITKNIADEINRNASVSLSQLTERYNVAGINLVNEYGIITDSTMTEFIGFDMASGAQSSEFLGLLSGDESYVQRYQPLSLTDSIYRKYAGVRLKNGGFVQVGYDGQRLHADISAEIKGACENRRIGKDGFFIVCDDSFHIISSNKSLNEQNLLISKDQTGRIISPDQRFTQTIANIPCFCMYTGTEGYYIVAALPVGEANFSKNIAVQILLFMEILVFAALFSHIYFLLKRLIVDNIRKINHSLSKITSGDLDTVVNVHSSKEFSYLSGDINATVATLKRYIREAEARIDQELEIARQIQSSALPTSFIRGTDFNLHALMNAAKEVGGDFYDFLPLENNRIMLAVADVSGKGIPGAMFMMRTKALIKALIERGKDVDEVLNQANNELCLNNEADMFVTAFVAVLDLSTGEMSYANAGHNPPLVRHKSGRFEPLPGRPNFVLAGIPNTKYRKQTCRLLPGDDLFLYTDGVTEAADENNHLYGEERLKSLLSGINTESAMQLCNAVSQDIAEFVKGHIQSDDITMLCAHISCLISKDSIRIFPDTASTPIVSEFLSKKLDEWKVTGKAAVRAKVALDEIYSNIVNYSSASESLVAFRLKHGVLCMEFEDNGASYDPTGAEEPNLSPSVSERKTGGLGIFMVRQSAQSMDYSRRNGKNHLTLTFDLSAE